MNELQSTKQINSLKVKAIRNGGFSKYKDQIIEKCKQHFEAFGIDLTPKHLKA